MFPLFFAYKVCLRVTCPRKHRSVTRLRFFRLPNGGFPFFDRLRRRGRIRGASACRQSRQRSRRTNAIAAVIPCSAFFPRFSLFSENNLRKRIDRCLPLVFFQSVLAAAHVRLRDMIKKELSLILFRQADGLIRVGQLICCING